MLYVLSLVSKEKVKLVVSICIVAAGHKIDAGHCENYCKAVFFNVIKCTL